jgi:hypothetical protein
VNTGFSGHHISPLNNQLILELKCWKLLMECL